ncbi:helix-turn-helix domain-containing protein [Aquimarina gracilis]|uniref:Helix-turn-helix domain-containing protein n=2 Tax=Aquimarina gracilis TaxID=874422 RepID=A0ABU5ZRW1_9FLAO|nr:helix-turn-helix domain-containing protein [Aquimarina gracilis]MEB3344312.1 helix-turn-helix domain-containing protein [Aquimarina gracilis]
MVALIIVLSVAGYVFFIILENNKKQGVPIGRAYFSFHPKTILTLLFVLQLSIVFSGMYFVIDTEVIHLSCFSYLLGATLVSGLNFIYSRRLFYKNQSELEILKYRKQVDKEATKEIGIQNPKIFPYKENAVFKKFMTLITEEKIYTDALLSLDKTAKMLGITAGYLSNILSENSSKNFSEIIGYYRTEEAKRMLKDERFDSYTILSIGYESGFNSKSSFYKTFKKNTGMTPNLYRKKRKFRNLVLTLFSLG